MNAFWLFICSKLIKNIGPTNTNTANTKNKVRSSSEHGKFPKSGIHLLHVGSKREILNRFQHISAKSSKNIFQSTRSQDPQPLSEVSVSKELRNSRVLEGFGSEFPTKFWYFRFETSKFVSKWRYMEQVNSRFEELPVLGRTSNLVFRVCRVCFSRTYVFYNFLSSLCKKCNLVLIKWSLTEPIFKDSLMCSSIRTFNGMSKLTPSDSVFVCSYH